MQLKKLASRILTAYIIMQISGCNSNIKETTDQVYSRHLQRQVAMSIVSTKMPADKSSMNLLILLNGDGLEKVQTKNILDSMYSAKKINPLMIVGIDGKAASEYGSTGEKRNTTDNKADNFNNFIINELLPFVKKKSGVRKFQSVTIAGSKRSGINAFEIAWNHADKINRAGIFSGAFEQEENKEDSTINSTISNMVQSSRKRPKLQYWFYAGNENDSMQVIHTRRFCSILQSKSFINSTDIMLVNPSNTGNEYADWANQFPVFIKWAVANDQ